MPQEAAADDAVEVDVPSPVEAVEYLTDQFRQTKLDQRTRVMAASAIINYYLAREIATVTDIIINGPQQAAPLWTPDLNDGTPTGMPGNAGPPQ